MNDDRERLLEEVTTAWRSGGDAGLRYHPAWHDLDEEGRREAFERTARARSRRPLVHRPTSHGPDRRRVTWKRSDP